LGCLLEDAPELPTRDHVGSHVILSQNGRCANRRQDNSFFFLEQIEE
jgi:hypothetical protein